MAQPRWEAYKPYLTWLIEDVGLLGELMVSTFEPYLRAYRELTAAEVESLLRYFFRYHLTLAEEPLERALPRLKARLRLQPLGTTGKVVATVTTRGTAKELARVELLTRLVPEVHDQVHVALESLLNVVSGATTLATLLPDAAREHLGASATTDLQRYLRDGETFAALVETAKGAVQVGTGTAGLCVVGGLTTLAGVALSQVVAVGLVAIAMADVVIYVDTGGASPVQNFKDGSSSASAGSSAMRADGPCCFASQVVSVASLDSWRP